MPRYAQNREFYIPKDYTEKLEGPTKGTEIFLYTDTKGRPCAKGFRGRAKKSTFHYHYQSEAVRAERVKRWQVGEAKEAAAKAEYRAKMKAPHSLKVGDILASSWGYEQTNVDFYQVTATPTKFYVELRKIAADLEQTGNLSMQGYSRGIKDNFIGEPFRKRPDGENVVTISSFAFARPWDGKPKHVSWYG